MSSSICLLVAVVEIRFGPHPLARRLGCRSLIVPRNRYRDDFVVPGWALDRAV